MSVTDVETGRSAAGDEGARRPGGKDAPADGEKKSKKKVIIIALVVVLLLGGFVAKGKFLKPHYRHGQKVPNGQVYSLGSMTFNTSDAHILQATIDLQLTAPASTKTVGTKSPELSDAALTVVAGQTYQGLLAVSGRQALRHQLLVSFQHILGTSEGAQEVSAVYFEAFVLQ